MSRPCPHIVVVGAGMAGASVALELVKRGGNVTLMDQDDRPLHRASRRNEGKIHLGFVYANEPDRPTARLMAQGAVSFAPLLRRWLGPDILPALTPSTPFNYLVHRDSVVSPEDFEAHCAAVEDIYHEENRQFGYPGYLGSQPTRLWRRMESAEIAPHRGDGAIAHGVATEELAVDTDRLAVALGNGLRRQENLTWMGETRVHAFSRKGDGFQIAAERRGAPLLMDADIVVNATWERRCALDSTLGIEPPPDILHRLKYRVIAQLPPEWVGARSMTMVTGPYGDIVARQDGTAFLSWYPVGRVGWTHDIEPPRAWDAPSSGQADAAFAGDIARRILAALDTFYRGIAGSRILTVDAGPIVAIGRSDVDDKSSGLHHRCAVGHTEHDGFFSLDPGKMTSAPLLGCRLAGRIAGLLSLPVTGTPEERRLMEAIHDSPR